MSQNSPLGGAGVGGRGGALDLPLSDDEEGSSTVSTFGVTSSVLTSYIAMNFSQSGLVKWKFSAASLAVSPKYGIQLLVMLL